VPFVERVAPVAAFRPRPTGSAGGLANRVLDPQGGYLGPRQERFERLLGRCALRAPAPLERSKGAGASVARLVGSAEQVVLRTPPNFWQAMRIQHGTALMAIKLEAPDLVEPASAIQGPNGPQMAMGFAEGFVPAIDAPGGWRYRIGYVTRVFGALLDHLHDHSDKSIRNVMVNVEGAVRQIDPDGGFGRRDATAAGGVRSAFSPGEPLGYDAWPNLPQGQFSDLPPAAQSLVTSLARQTPAQIQYEYGYSLEEARKVKQQAVLVWNHGLSRAIELASSHRASPWNLRFTRQ
jgi:hypothetical protein